MLLKIIYFKVKNKYLKSYYKKYIEHRQKLKNFLFFIIK